MKSLCTVGIVLCLSACATTQTGTQNYATLVSNVCAVATPEITALQSVQTDLSANDQTALAAIAQVIAPACANPSGFTQSVYEALQSELPAITLLLIEYKK